MEYPSFHDQFFFFLLILSGVYQTKKAALNKTRFTVCDFTNVDDQDYSKILIELIEKFNSVSVGLKSQMKIYSALIPGKIYH